MSTRIPFSDGRPRPINLAMQLREAFLALNDLAVVRLADAGHEVMRPSHSAVFQYLDDTGTSVSELADRAQITKQAMGELVSHLEHHGYVTRIPDPDDRRAKLVLPTDRGNEVFDIVRELVPDIEELISQRLGAKRIDALRRDLDTIHQVARDAAAGDRVCARGM